MSRGVRHGHSRRPNLDAPAAGRQRDALTPMYKECGFEVRAPGMALADAAAEQRVRVRNLNSLKIVEGVADTAGVVRVNP